MKLAALVLPFVAACPASGSGDYPIGPGGGGPVVISGGSGGGGGGDAGTGDGGGGGSPIDGRVCLLKDLRHMSGCSDVGADGLVVALAVGNPQTVKVTAVTTDGAGHFSIVPPLCTDCTWRVTSTTDERIVRSLMPFGTDPTIPVIGFDDYTTLLGANGQVLVDQGSVVVRAVSGATPAPQVTVAVTTLPLDVALADAVFYDSDASKDVWNQTATQSSGVVWLPLVPLSATPSPTTSGTITLARQTGGTVTTTATILSAWITFLTTDIP
jgi:hypothetical protein